MHYVVLVAFLFLAIIALQMLAFFPLHVLDALRLPSWLLWGAIALLVAWLMGD
jgi:hypothetical protein